MQLRMVLGYSAAAFTAICLMLFVGWWQVDGPGSPKSLLQRPLGLSDMDFRLTDHDGTEVGPGTLVGRPTMVFFGFTHCPDVCPTTLADISGWLDALQEDARRLNVIFVTVDPERDTVDTMAEYVGNFHPMIRGWTGPASQITPAVKGFRAKFEMIPTVDDDYTMNHTASVFLFDATGRFVSTIDYHEPEEFAVPKILRTLKAGAEQMT